MPKTIQTLASKLTLSHYLMFAVALILATCVFFPSRVPGLLSMINRYTIAAIFVQLVFALTPSLRDSEDSTSLKAMVLSAALIGAGMSV